MTRPTRLDRPCSIHTVVPAHLVDLDRRIPRLPPGRSGRHRGRRPGRQPPVRADRRRRGRAGHRRRPGPAQPPAPGPAPLDPRHHRRDGPRAAPGRRRGRLPHLPGRPRPDGRHHRSPARRRASRRATVPRSPPLGLGGRDARPVGPGLDHDHPRRNPRRGAVHRLRRLRSYHLLRPVRRSCFTTCCPTAPQSARPRRRRPAEATV